MKDLVAWNRGLLGEGAIGRMMRTSPLESFSAIGSSCAGDTPW